MKKLRISLAVIMTVVCVFACAAAGLAETTQNKSDLSSGNPDVSKAPVDRMEGGTPFTADGMFRVTVPSDYVIDTLSYVDENDEEYQWLFWAEGEMFSIDCGIYDWRELYGSLSLFSASATEMTDYLDENLEYFEEYNAEYITLLYANYNNTKIPFSVYNKYYVGNDDYDDTHTYYAETIVNGYGIYFEVYYDVGDEEEALEELELIVTTFTPIV